MAEQGSLFGSDNNNTPANKKATPTERNTPGEPLASRMRPRSLDEVIGQEHKRYLIPFAVLAKGSSLVVGSSHCCYTVQQWR